jgi:hypothetical protein
MARRLLDFGSGGILDHLQLCYEPFPAGISRPAFPADTYQALVETWPPQDAFKHMPELGNKYSLSEKNNPAQYRAFLDATPAWHNFHSFVKAPTFIPMVFGALSQHSVDLGLDVQTPSGTGQRLKRSARNAKLWITGRGITRLSARFEFSMLPADGGCIKPHTDDPSKLATLVFSMNAANEWSPDFGGSTDMLRPLDPRRYFNHLNRQLEFDEVETIASYPFEPNQCLLFVKTFNSLHSVGPMTGYGCPTMRKTLTVNIEKRS